MVLVCGIPSEPPLEKVIEALLRMGEHTVVFHQRQFEEAEISWRMQGGRLRGWLKVAGAGYPLESFKGVYARMIDPGVLPEVRNDTPGHPKLRQAHAVYEALTLWMEATPIRVINRLSAMLSNGSKPYQAQLIRRFGLEIPPTLITSSPAEVKAFRKRYKHIVYKSISGVRSIVKEFGPEDEAKLDRIRWCPVQFQAMIRGFDVRVHVVGDKAIATKIVSAGTDYRYAGREGKATVLEPFEPGEEVADRCVRLTRSLGLVFSGIDLKFSPDGKVYCFEVNPSPGYSYFESHTGQPIAAAVAACLAA